MGLTKKEKVIQYAAKGMTVEQIVGRMYEVSESYVRRVMKEAGYATTKRFFYKQQGGRRA